MSSHLTLGILGWSTMLDGPVGTTPRAASKSVKRTTDEEAAAVDVAADAAAANATVDGVDGVGGPVADPTSATARWDAARVATAVSSGTEQLLSSFTAASIDNLLVLVLLVVPLVLLVLLVLLPCCCESVSTVVVATVKELALVEVVPLGSRGHPAASIRNSDASKSRRAPNVGLCIRSCTIGTRRSKCVTRALGRE
jgi:hypothetical protein